MRISGVVHDFRRTANSRGRVALFCLRFAAAFWLLLPAGCSKAVKPGASYNVWILAKGNDGKAAPQGSATRVESATVQSVQEISTEGQTLSLVVRKTQYGKATFDIVFPDKTTHRVQAKAGEPKDILPSGQRIGVRIEILDSH